jgi:uncharacterized protein YqgQ
MADMISGDMMTTEYNSHMAQRRDWLECNIILASCYIIQLKYFSDSVIVALAPRCMMI